MPNKFNNEDMDMGTDKNESPTPMDDWQELVANIIVNSEYKADQSNMEKEHKDMDAILDMLVCDRSEKDYDWQSDIFIPDFPAIHLTQIGELVSQYFGRWEKVDCVPPTNDPMDVLKGKAAKDFLNYHLNARYMHYLPKFIRQTSLARLFGWCVIKLHYESDIEMKEEQTGVRDVPRGTGVDIYGTQLEESPYPERMTMTQEPIMEQRKIINKDRPNFEVWPNHNVFMDNKYVYSLQDKDHVIFRDEVKLSKLREESKYSQYMNLDLLKQDVETDAENATYNKKSKAGEKYDRIIQKFDPDIERLERWGKWPVIVTEDQKFVSGIDEDGNIFPDAQLVETIITVANFKTKKHIIRFQPNIPELGGYGFRPIIRFMCYIHPTKDRGMGEGMYARELQKAINDTFNMNNDRTRMATFPTIKKRKYALVDNDTLQFGPEHVMELENMDDVDIIQITDNIQGGLIQQDMLFNKMQQILAKYTMDLGSPPGKGQPVTTTMLAEQKSNIRDTLVNLTLEHTGLGEFYDMMLKMAGMFMQPETLQSILGDMTMFFDPNVEYNFVPVSTAILTEHAKESKIQIWDQILGRIVSIPNPRTFALVNLIMKEILELAGKEYSHYGDFLLDENAPNPELLKILLTGQQAQQGGKGQPKKQQAKPQNQYGNEQTFLEQQARGMGTLAGGGRA